MPRGRPCELRGYGVAAAALAIMVGIRMGLQVAFDERTPTYLIFLVPIFVAAVLGGPAPGLVTTALSWFISHYFFVEPTFNFKTESDDLIVAGVFLVEGMAITAIGWYLRAAVSGVLTRERQLAASETRLLMAQAAARIATYEWDPSGDRARWSENTPEIVGMAPGSFEGTFEGSQRMSSTKTAASSLMLPNN